MRYIIAIVFSIFSLGAAAQSGYFEDDLRFSQSFPAGSARIMAIGGTQWSLGGDVSNIAGNPAGLGFSENQKLQLVWDTAIGAYRQIILDKTDPTILLIFLPPIYPSYLRIQKG